MKIDFSRFQELKPTQQFVGVIENVGMFTIKSANQTLKEAALRPDPIPLWKTLWYEGEVCCLFSDSNLGKSIYAVQIATSIAENQKVLLFDFELSDKQFQLRYTDDFGNRYSFPENLFRGEINKEITDIASYEDSIVNNIEQAAVQTGARVLIIDNLTYMCLDSEKGKDAGALMLRLMDLKRKYELSILVLAHTPKRNLTNIITQNDLAGSKKLYNFFDSAFAIGQSAKDSKLRYIKQLKVRYGEYTYDSENVILVSIVKVDCFLQFEELGVTKEWEHLKEKEHTDNDELREKAAVLKDQGMSYRDIGKELNIDKSKVHRLLK